DLARRARAGGGIVLRVEPNDRVGDQWPAFFEGRGFVQGESVQPEATQLLRIDLEPATLKAGFKPKTRYNLNLAERKGVTVIGSRDVAIFARLAGDTAKRQGIHLPGVAYYQAAIDLFSPRDEVRLYRFKTGFCGEPVRYIGLYQRVLRPGTFKLERRLQQLKARVRQPILR